jgi:hypothetical protein
VTISVLCASALDERMVVPKEHLRAIVSFEYDLANSSSLQNRSQSVLMSELSFSSFSGVIENQLFACSGVTISR